MKILAVASYDSFLKTVVSVGKEFDKAAHEVDIALLHVRSNQISQAQIEQLDLPFSVQQLNMDSLCSRRALEDYDVFLMSVDGVSFRRFFLRLEKYSGLRPLIVAMYPGLILRYAFDGLSSRSAVDFLWLNSPKDFNDYVSMCSAFNIDSTNARDFGLSALLYVREKSSDLSNTQDTIVFFEQAIIPRSIEDRKYLGQKLLELAKRYPHYKFLIKPRTKPTEHTLHRTKAHIQFIIEKSAKDISGMPENISITYNSVDELLLKAKVCLTISSTVSIEALYSNVPTIIIGDFGSHDDTGLPFFFGSNLIQNFATLDLDNPPAVDQEWLKKVVTNPKENLKKHINEIEDAVTNHRIKQWPVRSLSPAVASKERFTSLFQSQTIDSIGYRAYERSTSVIPTFIVNLYVKWLVFWQVVNSKFK